MSEDLVIGRKELIRYFQGRLRLPSDQKDAWQKICRWRKKYGLELLFHHDVNGKPYIIPVEIEAWDGEVQRLEAAEKRMAAGDIQP
jgi:hypothetical protein